MTEKEMLALRFDGELYSNSKTAQYENHWIILIAGTPDVFVRKKSKNEEEEVRKAAKEYEECVLEAFDLNESDDPILIWEAYPLLKNGILVFGNIEESGTNERDVIINMFQVSESEHKRLFKNMHSSYIFSDIQYNKYGEDAYVTIKHAYQVILMKIGSDGRYILAEKTDSTNTEIKYGIK